MTVRKGLPPINRRGLKPVAVNSPEWLEAQPYTQFAVRTVFEDGPPVQWTMQLMLFGRRLDMTGDRKAKLEALAEEFGERLTAVVSQTTEKET